MSQKTSYTFDISGGKSLEITLIFAFSTLRPASDTLNKRGFFLEYIFQVIRKRFKFKIHRRFFKRCFDIVIGVKGVFHRRIDGEDHSFSSNFEMELLLFNSNYCIDSVKKRVSRDNFAYKEYGMRLMLAPKSAKAFVTPPKSGSSGMSVSFVSSAAMKFGGVKEELRDSMDVVPRDDVAIDVESIATKYPIVD
ncbi:hypothetical protein Tco_0793931 [Tanacetum coccineum]